MRNVKASEIVDTFTACPYCMTPVNGLHGHCGESNAHFELAHELADGETLLASEITIQNERV